MANAINSIDFNLRAGRYVIAEAGGACPRCRLSSRLLALALLSGHEILEFDEASDDAGVGDTWAVAGHTAFLFHVAHLSEDVRSRLVSMSATYRPKAAAPGIGSHWANHCEHCGAPFDDQELFCEPGGAFLPVSDADARLIRLLMVDEAFAADAAGYAHEPQFFASMRRT